MCLAEGVAVLLLVAEDRSSLRDVIAIFLESEGFSVRTATHGGEVIDFLKAGTVPELLIADLHMPVCDGNEVVRFVRTSPLHAGLPILVMTGSVKPSFDAGEVQAVLIKPFDLRDLLAHVRSLLP
jgi:two-component system chemotaxis response regulator CheY